MLNLVVVGLNHRTAKLELRERMAYPAPELPGVLKRLTQVPGIEEGIIISTCNRVEVISHVQKSIDGRDALENFLAETRQIPREELQNRLYSFQGKQAVRHLFRLASSLDSMVLGEPQVLGQVKSSYGTALDASTVGPYLNPLLQAAFKTAKRVRAETAIGEYAVSVSSAAVDLARKIFGSLRQVSILVVGAGEMAELALRHMAGDGVPTIRIANRNPEAAQRLAARFSAVPVVIEELPHWLAMSDIVIASTGSPDILVSRSLAQSVSVKRKSRPIVFIDISVPRNVDPAVGAIDNIFYYDMDDLGAVVDANLEERQRESAEAERIVDQEVDSFCHRMKFQDIAPLIVEIQGRIDAICRSELQRFLRRSGPRDEKEVRELEWMLSRVAGKIAHPLIAQLKTTHKDPHKREAYLEAIRQIVQTEQDADGRKPL